MSRLPPTPHCKYHRVRLSRHCTEGKEKTNILGLNIKKYLRQDAKKLQKTRLVWRVSTIDNRVVEAKMKVRLLHYITKITDRYPQVFPPLYWKTWSKSIERKQRLVKRRPSNVQFRDGQKSISGNRNRPFFLKLSSLVTFVYIELRMISPEIIIFVTLGRWLSRYIIFLQKVSRDFLEKKTRRLIM